MSGIIAQNSGRHTGLVKASSGGGGVWNLILTQTASADSTISFTSGIDSTYDEYVFKFINIHPSADDGRFAFNVSIDSGSNYNVAKQSSFFRAYHFESESSAALSYQDDDDLALGTGVQNIFNTDLGNDNDQSLGGYLHLYSLSDTTFVKHFIGSSQASSANDTTTECFFAGYANTASAIDAVQFSMTSGNIDSGTISLFGIS
jgi:hypothetical protein